MTVTGKQAAIGYMVCVDNSDYLASLELGKAYEVLPDENAETDEIRVVDESGEDYLYPADYFSSEGQMVASSPALYSDIAREIRGFIEENEGLLLSEASPLVLGRVFTQGAQIFTTINEEVVEGANRATSTKNALAAAIRDPTTPPRRLQELEAEETHASRVYEARMAASKELGDFLDRVKALLPEQETEEGRGV